MRFKSESESLPSQFETPLPQNKKSRPQPRPPSRAEARWRGNGDSLGNNLRLLCSAADWYLPHGWLWQSVSKPPHDLDVTVMWSPSFPLVDSYSPIQSSFACTTRTPPHPPVIRGGGGDTIFFSHKISLFSTKCTRFPDPPSHFFPEILSTRALYSETFATLRRQSWRSHGSGTSPLYLQRRAHKHCSYLL